MLVSILMSSHNYARYLPTAIDSALAQTHPHVELIVVDDGSTDGSRDIIRSYGDRVTAIFKPQGGQVSALNLGFEHTRGELVCLLDADDVFLPTKVERVVAAARACPQACLIHHQMQMVDAEGVPFHAPFPRRVPRGDLRGRARRSGGWFARVYCSALSFRRSYAQRMFPVPAVHRLHTDAGVREVKLEVDTYLLGPAALLAPVAGIDEPLTQYRIHGVNRYAGAPKQEMMARYRAETEVLEATMRDRLGQPVELDVEDHLEYQLLRCASGELSRAQTVRRVLGAPGLPLAMRPREALRVLANRGTAARV